MTNTINMNEHFERKKNMEATAYTVLITVALLFLFILVKMTIPQEKVAIADEAIDVDLNLGNGDLGSGTDQPQLPGDPAPAQAASYSPPQAATSREESVRDVSSNDNSNDAPPVLKPAVTKPDATKINAEPKTVKTNNTVPEPVTPTPPRPKAVLGRTVGGNGNGGNGADTYKPGSNEGVAGGNGDQGRPGGNPNGRDYTGTPRNLGVRIVNMPAQNFEDDFNESGNIVLDVVVNDAGKLVSASYQISGSTLARSSKQYNIALRRAGEIAWPKYEGGFKQRVSFTFKVH